MVDLKILPALFLFLCSPIATLGQTDCLSAKASRGHWATHRTSAATSDSIDILHQGIQLDLTQVGSGSITGRCLIKCTPRVNGITHLPLDLLALTVDSVTQGGNTLGHTHVGEALRIDLGGTFSPSDTLELVVHYHGDPVIDASGFGGFYTAGTYIYNLGVAFEAQPHSFGRAWFPCFDNFVERSTYSLEVLTNGGRSTWCNGERMSVTPVGVDSLLTEWTIWETIPAYLVSVAAAPYAVVRDTFPSISGDPIPVDLVALPGDTADLKASFLHLKDAFDTFEATFGPYRWNRVGYVLTTTGAMEHSTNIAYPAFIANGNLQYETTMAHELAHQWFGDLVTCARAEEMYINEGFAEYLSYLFMEAVYGHEAYLEIVQDNHRAMVHRAHLLDEGWWPLAEVPQEWTYGEHSYNKGADVLHTLRSYLGDSLFRVGCTSFLDTYAFAPVSTFDLRDHLTSATGVDLSDYFDDWILQGGWAAFEVDSLQSVPQGNSFLTTIFLEQKLRGADHLYTNAPLRFTFLDDQGNAWDAPDPLLLSGANPTAQVITPFAPNKALPNTDEGISLAITTDVDTLDGPGTRQFDRANLRLTVSAMPTPTPIRLQQFWVAADEVTDETWAYVVSPDRWWRITADLPPGADISTRIMFDGRTTPSGSLDVGLMQDQGGLAFHEDSMVVLYRPDARFPWSPVADQTLNTMGSATDKFGRVDFTGLVAGDYCLAWRKSAVTVQEARPIAAPWQATMDMEQRTIRIHNPSGGSGMVRVHDLKGAVVKEQRCQEEYCTLALPALASGAVQVDVLQENGTVRDLGRFVVMR